MIETYIFYNPELNKIGFWIDGRIFISENKCIIGLYNYDHLVNNLNWIYIGDVDS